MLFLVKLWVMLKLSETQEENGDSFCNDTPKTIHLQQEIRGFYKSKGLAEDNDLEISPEIKQKDRGSWSQKKSM